MDIQQLKVTIELWQKEEWIVARILELDIVFRNNYRPFCVWAS